MRRSRSRACSKCPERWRHAPDWLTARPIAHRGLHDAAGGLIENTAGAVRAAIDGAYGIEVDLQLSADGEAMVHHDDVLGRLTEGAGRLDRMTAAELQRVPFRDSAERMMTLGELCDLVAGRAAMLIELKSRFDGDSRLPARVAAVLAGYHGPVAPMSFDPKQLNVLRHKSPRLPRGIVAAKYRPHPIGIGCHPGCVTAWVPAAVLDGPAAFRGLCGRRSAGAGALARAAHFGPAAADLGGADSARATARRPLRRPDDLRGLSAMNLGRTSRRPQGSANRFAAGNLRITAIAAISEIDARPTGTPAPIRRMAYDRAPHQRPQRLRKRHMSNCHAAGAAVQLADQDTGI